MGRAAIATLTLNPSVDLSFFVDRFAPGEKLRCAAPRRDAGGGGVNVARVVRRLGGRAMAIFPAGGANGERLTALVRAERLPHLAQPIAGETREDITAEARESGEQYRFVMPGPTLGRTEWRGLLETAIAVAPKVLVASGSLPPGAPITFYRRLAGFTRDAGIKFALDSSGLALRHGLAGKVWLVKPNLVELQQVIGCDLRCMETRRAACRSIVARGDAEIVALSLGAEGALLVTQDVALQASAPKITPASAVGAGDSFLGGLVHALTEGNDLGEALRWGVACGTAAIAAPGTQLCRAADARRLFDRVCVAAV